MNRSRRLSARLLIFDRDQYTCYLCNKRYEEKQLQVDHIFPFSKGGENTLNNLRTTCKACNNAKRAKMDFKLAADAMLADPAGDAIWINTSILKTLSPKYYTTAVKEALLGNLQLKEGRP